MHRSEVIISPGSRGGTLSYRNDDHDVPFDWELCGSEALMIWGTKKPSWNINYPWAVGRQSEIYDFVAREVIRQKAPAANFRIDLESGTITILWNQAGFWQQFCTLHAGAVESTFVRTLLLQ